MSDPYMGKYVPRSLEDEPELRDWMFPYYQTLGYSAMRFHHLVTYIRESCHDDSSLFQACMVMINWNIPLRRRQDVLKLSYDLSRLLSMPSYASCLWLLAKYGDEEDIISSLIDSL